MPLLVENSLYKKANRVLVVDVSPETQLKRTMQRDDVTREHVEQILLLRQRAKPALPWQMTSLIITAHRMLSHRMLPACTHTICSLRRSLSHRKTVMQTQVLFEHPLNEKMRTWLRIEF